MKYCSVSFFVYASVVIFFSSVFFNGKVYGQDTTVKKVERKFYGQASFYANKFNGRKTASGELFNQNKLTCACNAVPLGTWLRITHVKTKKSVIVKVNDRIHPKMRRVVDLSSGAAKKIGITSANGVGRVMVEVLGKTKPSE